MSGAQMRVLHAAMDMDHDKLASLDEAAQLVTYLRTQVKAQQTVRIMTTMDTNGDGGLSAGELQEDLRHTKLDASLKEHLVSSFSSFDKDGDALLSLEEVQPLYDFMLGFQKFDTNKDRLLTRREFKQIAAEKLAGASPEEVKKSDDESKAIFAGLDSDGDKRLNALEYYAYSSGVYAGLAALDKLFEMADTDGNKALSAEELVECRHHQQFPGSAAYHHSQDWINKLEEMVKISQAQAAQTAGQGSHDTKAEL